LTANTATAELTIAVLQKANDQFAADAMQLTTTTAVFEPSLENVANEKVSHSVQIGDETALRRITKRKPHDWSGGGAD